MQDEDFESFLTVVENLALDQLQCCAQLQLRNPVTLCCLLIKKERSVLLADFGVVLKLRYRERTIAICWVHLQMFPYAFRRCIVQISIGHVRHWPRGVEATKRGGRACARGSVCDSKGIHQPVACSHRFPGSERLSQNLFWQLFWKLSQGYDDARQQGPIIASKANLHNNPVGHPAHAIRLNPQPRHGPASVGDGDRSRYEGVRFFRIL